MPKQIDINRWLNTHLFQRPYLYPIFEVLYKSGADLDYVLFLCLVFRLWEETRRSLGFDRRRGLIPLSRPNTKLNGEQRLSEVMRGARDALSHPVKVQKLLDFEGEAEILFREVNQFLSDMCVKVPLFTLFVQFGCPREFFNGKGDPGDPWGNFFLLAVTEHLGSGGRGLKSKHDLAYRLLTKLRKGEVSIENPKVSTAGRVEALKKKSQWQAALSLLESEFSKLPPTLVLVLR